MKAIEQCFERSDSFLADLMLLPLLEQPGESDEMKQALCKMLAWNVQSLENVLAVPRFQGLEEDSRPLPRNSLDKWEAFLPELKSKQVCLVEDYLETNVVNTIYVCRVYLARTNLCDVLFA